MRQARDDWLSGQMVKHGQAQISTDLKPIHDSFRVAGRARVEVRHWHRICARVLKSIYQVQGVDLHADFIIACTHAALNNEQWCRLNARLVFQTARWVALHAHQPNKENP